MTSKQSNVDSAGRRAFIRKSIGGVFGAATMGSSLSLLHSVNAMAASVPNSDYKALVCIFLLGGNDSFNMLVPRSGASYDQYLVARQQMALPQAELLPISHSGTNPVEFGLHPAMSGVQQLFGDGALSFIANCGALVEPTTKQQYDDGSVALPPRLFSHNDQQQFAMRLQQDGGSPTGWAGRMADLLADSSASLSMNVSLSGTNLWQIGGQTSALAMGNNGISSINSINPDSRNAITIARRAAFLDLLNTDTGHTFANQFAAKQSRAIDSADLVSQALEQTEPLTTVFPSSNLGGKLASIARLIKAREHFGLSRQIYFVGMGGWDTHGSQLASHQTLLGELSEGMAAFYAATQELTIADKVTTFTASDFGRTLSTNGDGTDHGWGGNQMVMGGAVNGGQIYGDYPELLLGGDNDLGRGRIIPTTSVDQISATLARWYASFSDTEMNALFPNLANFTKSDLGFMA